MDYVTHIQRAIDEIETRLRETISVEQLARRAGFSYWHFQRVFAATVGEPVAFYIRRRRLTAAAQELHTSPRRILDVALDYRFESHEAFTRAFRTVFDLSPSEFRRRRHIIWGRSRPKLTADKLKHLARQAAMEPVILELPVLTLVGPEAHFISAMSPDANNLKIIPPLWRTLFARRAELGPALDKYSYGACRLLPASQRTREDEIEYLAGVSLKPDAPVPAGMGRWTVPASMYAMFTHRGPISNLSETINYVHGAWLPRSNYDYGPFGTELERYDERFGEGGEGSELDFLLAIKPRK